MYTSFRVQNFRCFEDLELNNLARINLIGGKNNTGKTSLLEAVMLHSGNFTPDILLRGSRHFEGDDWKEVFLNFNGDLVVSLTGDFFYKDGQLNNYNPLEIRIILDNEKRKFIDRYTTRALLLKNTGQLFNQNNLSVFEFKYRNQIFHVEYYEQQSSWDAPVLFPAILLRALKMLNYETIAERFGKLVKDGKKNFLLSCLQLIEPRLIDIDDQFKSSIKSSIIYGDLGLNEKVYLDLMGDGIKRLTDIIVAMSECEGGVLLIDEIENGLHHSILPDIWRAIHQAALAFNVQIFATTHSDEMIHAAQQAFANDPDALRYHRLARSAKTGQIKVATYEPHILENAMEGNFEVR